MGSTIRREPVSFGIPAKPKYQFSNITEFGGLNITDNPFTAPTNTASDMLNVYVDEANALTTRPRLEKKFGCVFDGEEILNVYSLTDGFLIHSKTTADTPVYKLRIRRGNTVTAIGDTDGLTPHNKFSYFENNGVIYIIDGVKYLQIKTESNAYNLYEVEGYIPTAKIGVQKYDEDGNSYYENGIDFEQLNLLSDKYIEKRFWNGVDPLTYDSLNLYDVENQYLKKVSFENETLLGCSNNHIIITRDAFGNNKKTYKKIFNPSTGLWESSIAVELTPDLGSNIRIAKETNRIIRYSSSTLFVYDYDGYDNEYSLSGFINNTTDSNEYPRQATEYQISDDGTVISFYNGKDNTNSDMDPCSFRINLNSDISQSGTLTKLTFFTTSPSTGHKSVFKSFYHSPQYVYLVETLLNDATASSSNPPLIFINIYANYSATNARLVVLSSPIANALGVKEAIRAVMLSDTVLLVSLPNKFYLCEINQDTRQYVTPYRTINLSYYHSGFSVDVSNKKLFVYKTDSTQYTTDVMYYDLLSDTDNVNNVKLYSLNLETDLDSFYDERYLFYNTASNVVVDGLGSVETIAYQNLDEPGIQLTYSTENLPEQNAKRLERREKFLNSTLTKRWNNEQWFASGNTLFRTINNDPTYISLTSFTELGNTEEPITGFNIAQDNLFLVYKNDRIYAVQYGEVLENTYDYQYTETKNNVGNDAPGNCIVSTLTEMPLQVSYDGIYALNQLQNVLTSDRICVPISDSINVKWLKETKNAIENCITLNRLYWTYFILAYKRSDYGVNYNKEFDFVGTKVYLLDNRSGQWFYWELPIITVNAFSKDNKTHFVDKDGNVYTLETDDIINKYNNELTEYYDAGGKLIPWKWVSQIMPLGTINYSKRLIDTTFILTDTDTTDEYGLVYKFKSFRKMASQTSENTINNKLNYVQSVTKKTLIPRCNFIQLELSNIEDDKDNNKLRLIGLGFRYVLLEGLY